MELTIVDPAGTPADVVVRAPGGTPFATVATRLPPAAQWWCAGRPVASDAAFGVPPLVRGAVLSAQPESGTGPAVPDVAPSSAPSAGVLQLRVVAGPDAGAVHALAQSGLVVGRGNDVDVRLRDPCCSRRHAVVSLDVDGVRVRDLNGTNPATLDGQPIGPAPVAMPLGARLRLGDSVLVVVAPDDTPAAVRPTGDGRLAVNRPPRLRAAAQPPVTVEWPARPAPPERARLPLAAVLAPVVLGAVLAVLVGPQLVAFVLVSPLLLVATWLGDRLGGRRARRRAVDRYAADCVLAEDRLAGALAAERAARDRADPDPAALLHRAAATGSRLWERRLADGDALVLRIGTADLPAATELRAPPGDGSGPPGPTADGVPLAVPLAEVGVLGMAGPVRQVRGLAAQVVGRLAVLHSPREVGLAVVAPDGGPDWSWTRWLPHLSSSDDDGPRLATDQAAAAALMSDVGRLVEHRMSAVDGTRAWRGHVLVVVIDGSAGWAGGFPARADGGAAWTDHPATARVLVDGPRVGVFSICLEREERRLPAECRALAVLGDGPATRLRLAVAGQADVGGAVPDVVDRRWAEAVARSLAAFVDATPGERSALPSSVRLLDLLDRDDAAGASRVDVLADRVAQGWQTDGGGARVLLGVGAEGPYEIDLARDGPHALVAGTTGSGKSELLRTLVAGLALAHRPDELAMVLVDYKGGAAFAECRALPHVTGVVTDLDGALAERAIASLSAEIRRRERVLDEEGAKDLGDLAARLGPRALPRLVLVVDEFATLAEELPDFVRGLVGVAQRGRSLGVHLVLATQRPGGAVTPDIRANTNLRIALRMLEPADSRDVIDRPDAVLLPAGRPGRALVRTAAGQVETVQTAHVGSRPAAPEELAVLPARRTCATVESAGSSPSDVDSDLAVVVRAVVTAAARVGATGVPPPWLPPLPATVTLDELPRGPAASLTVGLVDQPAQQAQEPYVLPLDRGGHLLVAGAPGSGRTSLLRAIAGAVAGECDPADVHVYALDVGAGGLAALAALPHVGAVVARDETERGDRLVARLLAEVARRQQALGSAGHGSLEEQRATAPPGGRLPWLLVLVDGWEPFVAAYETVGDGRAIDGLLRLAREGAAVGIRLVVTGDRACLTGRLAAAVDQRLVLRLADRADAALAGIPVRAVPDAMPPGRAVRAGDHATVQVALLDRDPSGAAQAAALAERVRRAGWSPAPAGSAPFRVDVLPGTVDLAGLIDTSPPPTAAGPLTALIGRGGDDGGPLWIDLTGCRPGVTVVGPPESGRSTALRTLARSLARRGCPVVAVTPYPSALGDVADEPGVVGVLAADEDERLRHLLGAEGPLAVVVDDADALTDEPVGDLLCGLAGRRGGPPRALVVAGEAEELAATFRGVTVHTRRSRSGLLLCPRGPLDGDLLGVRLPRGAVDVRPGRGLLVQRGRITTVQVAV